MKEIYLHGSRTGFVACIRIQTREELPAAVFAWTLIRAGWTVEAADVDMWNSLSSAEAQQLETGPDYTAHVRAVQWPRKAPAEEIDISDL